MIWAGTEQLGVGMTKGDDGRVVAVARYFPKGNLSGQIKANVKPPLHVNPFDLNTFSKTREEANLNVQTALIAPEVCQGVAKRLNRQLMGDNPKIKMKRKKKLLGSKPPLLIPNGRLPLPLLLPLPIAGCCGPPAAGPLAEAETNLSTLVPPPRNEGLQVLSPSNLANSNAYQNCRPGSLLFENNSRRISANKHNSRTVTVQPVKSNIESLAPS